MIGAAASFLALLYLVVYLATAGATEVHVAAIDMWSALLTLTIPAGLGLAALYFRFLNDTQRQAELFAYAQCHPDEIQSIELKTSDETCVVTMRNKQPEVVATGSQAIVAAKLLHTLAQQR